MTKHPYLAQPDRAFWSRSVARNWLPSELVVTNTSLLRSDSRIMSAGSCFAANIVPYLEEFGYRYVRTEMGEANDRFGYELYSAAYGNIYTPRQWLQLIDRAERRFQPTEDRWAAAEGVIDPFRPGLPFPADSDEEFDAVTRSHLDRVLAAIAESDTFIFTLGLTEAWISTIDGAVFPACPGTIAGQFDASRHGFVNFSVAEIVADLIAAIDRMRAISSGLRILLTVSPVPLVATATGSHVYSATVYSKSVLRVAAEEVSRARPDVFYFPAYEIVTGPHSTGFFGPDLRSVTPAAVKTVVDVLFAHSEPPSAEAKAARGKRGAAETLSRQMAERDCEEAMSDPAKSVSSVG